MDKSLFDNARQNGSPDEMDLIDSFAKGSISRRTFVTRGSMLGLSAALMGSVIAACSSDGKSTGTTAAPGTTKPGTPGTTVAPGSTVPGTTTPPAAIKQGGTLRLAAQRPGGPVDPVAMDNLGSYTIATTSFEYLCGKGDGVILAPMLAESWEPNADGSEWTFKLRKGVKWHSGGDFTAKDVLATLDRLSVGNLKAYITAGAGTAVDDLTVKIKLNIADGQFPYQMSVYNPQSLITPVDYATGTTLDKKPDGTGPFKLTKYDVASGATFEANKDWWNGAPYLEKVEFIFSDDIATQISGLQGGAADAIVGFSVVGGDALFADTNLTVESIKGAAHRQLWMNTRDDTSVFKDVRVRQAIALGIDRQPLIDNILQGRGQIGNDHPIAPVYPFFDSAQAQRTRDVEKAKSLLADAGKSDLKVTMYVPKLLEIPQLAELMQTQLKDIGVTVDLKVESTDTFYGQWCKVYDSKVEPAGCDGGKDFGIVDYGNRGTPDVYLVKAYSTGEWNSAHYISEPFRAAVKTYQAALDLDGRKAPISEIQKIANEDVPYVIMYFYDSLTAYSKKVSGIVATGLGHYYLGKAGFTA
jgi:peptide/nickel transport system substrate-binding protein